MTQQYDRFNLEEEIHNVWNTEIDLDTILYGLNHEPVILSYYSKTSNHIVNSFKLEPDLRLDINLNQ